MVDEGAVSSVHRCVRVMYCPTAPLLSSSLGEMGSVIGPRSTTLLGSHEAVDLAMTHRGCLLTQSLHQVIICEKT